MDLSGWGTPFPTGRRCGAPSAICWRTHPGVFADERGDIKNICANVDMYSGLVYKMLKIPVEMYTGLFACARMAGWCAHRMEEMINGKRIIRPAYKAINLNKQYIPLCNRI